MPLSDGTYVQPIYIYTRAQDYICGNIAQDSRQLDIATHSHNDIVVSPKPPKDYTRGRTLRTNTVTLTKVKK